MSPEVARRVIKLFREIRPPDRAEYKLTPHELRLLKLLVEGHNYKTAAVAQKVSVTTIAFHMRNIYEKLQVHSKIRGCLESASQSPRLVLPFLLTAYCLLLVERSYLFRRRRAHPRGVFMCT